MSDRSWDVVIAGGGLVGASLALALSRIGQGALKILVIEGFPMPAAEAEPVYSSSFDARSTALSSGSLSIFEEFGIAGALAAHAARIQAIQVSDRGHFGSTLMRAEDQGWPALGYVIENAWLGRVLLSAMQQAAGVTTLSPATVDAAVYSGGTVQISLSGKDGEQTIDARLLVIADGAESKLRAALGIAARETDYHQCAVVANIAFDQPHHGCAYERFTADGPLALLPLPDAADGRARASLVWTLPPEGAEALSTASDAEFLAALQRSFGYRLGRLTRVGKRDIYPLKLIEATEQVRPGMVIAGNAAHALHPVAGQGFNLALRDAYRLAEAVVEAVDNGIAPGELTMLRRYVETQADDQAQTVMFSDRLIQIFGHHNPVVSVARNLGLVALDILPAAKRAFVAAAAGRSPGRATGKTGVSL